MGQKKELRGSLVVDTTMVKASDEDETGYDEFIQTQILGHRIESLETGPFGLNVHLENGCVICVEGAGCISFGTVHVDPQVSHKVQ